MSKQPTEQSREIDDQQAEFGYDKGGVPGPLVFLYVIFLTFCMLYVLDWLIPSWWSLEHHIDP